MIDINNDAICKIHITESMYCDEYGDEPRRWLQLEATKWKKSRERAKEEKMERFFNFGSTNGAAHAQRIRQCQYVLDRLPCQRHCRRSCENKKERKTRKCKKYSCRLILI